MKQVIIDTIKHVDFENKEGMMDYLIMAYQFLHVHNGKIEQSHRIFEERIDPCYHNIKSFPMSEYNSLDRSERKIGRNKCCMIESRRINNVINSTSDDEVTRKNLFLYYILYFSEWTNNGFNFRKAIKAGEKGVAERANKQVECLRNAEKWEKISVRFAATKAKFHEENRPLNDDECPPEDFDWRVQFVKERPIEYATISWNGGKDVYKFTGWQFNGIIKNALERASADIKVVVESLLNNDTEIVLTGGDLFDYMKRVAIFGFRMDSGYSNFGQYTSNRKTIIKEMARCLYPLYIFLKENRSNISNKNASNWSIIKDLLDIDIPGADDIEKYLGKSVSGEVLIWVDIGDHNSFSNVLTDTLLEIKPD